MLPELSDPERFCAEGSVGVNASPATELLGCRMGKLFQSSSQGILELLQLRGKSDESKRHSLTVQGAQERGPASGLSETGSTRSITDKSHLGISSSSKLNGNGQFGGLEAL